MGLLCACFWAKVGGISATLRLVSFADPKALFLSAADMDTQGKGLVSRIHRIFLDSYGDTPVCEDAGTESLITPVQR